MSVATPDNMPADVSPEPLATGQETPDSPTVSTRPDAPDQSGARRTWLKPFRAVAHGIVTLFRLVSLVLMLAVVAAIPVLNFVALGYMLEAEGQVARTGRLRHAFPLFRQASHLAGIALGIWICLMPLRYLSQLSVDAHVIEPGSPVALRLDWWVKLVWGLTTIHLLLALSQGGALSSFFRPLKNLIRLVRQIRQGDFWHRAGDAVRLFISSLQLRHYFLLGIKGFVVGLAWLAVPTFLYVSIPQRNEQPGPRMLVGGVLLTIVLIWIPFLQAHLAATGQLRDGFRLRQTRSLFQSAPLVWALTTVVVYLLALPLYLFKAFLLPQDVMWFVTLIFIVTIFPTRILTGWAYAQARRRHEAGLIRPWWWRMLARLVVFPAVGIFVFVLYFTQFLGEHGRRVVYEQHALLLPVPF